jgi:hypothetical protein
MPSRWFAWWPGRIKPGQVNQSVGSTMDLFDLAAQNPAVVADLLQEIENHKAAMKPGTPQR